MNSEFQHGTQNAKTTGLVTDRPLTVEEVADHFNIDMEVWKVDNIVTNVWQVGAKTEKKNLEWKEGVLSGEVRSTGTLNKENLYQTKVWWVRQEPIALHPILQPVNIDIKGVQLEPPDLSTPSESVFVIPDVHYGYFRDEDGELQPLHSQRAMTHTLIALNKDPVDTIVLLGDLMDFAEWSDRWPTPNALRDTTQEALNGAAEFLGQIRSLQPSARIILLEGNHEERMGSILRKLVPAAFGLKKVGENFPAISIPGLLGLEQLNIEFVGPYPGGEFWVDDYLRFTHGTIARKSGLSAGHYVNEIDSSTVFGHIHRIESASRSIWRGTSLSQIFAASPGCLCRLDGVVPAVKPANNWQHGYMKVYKDSDTRWIPELKYL